MLVGRAHESHGAVARRPVDRNAGLYQALADSIYIVNFIGEVAEITCLPIIFDVPIIGELDQRRIATGALALGDQALVLRRCQKYIGVSPLGIVPPAHFLKPELVAIEVEGAVEIADAQHGMQIAHEDLSLVLPKGVALGTTIYDCT